MYDIICTQQNETRSDKMYVCLDCLKHFKEPRLYIEKHGLDTPPYEQRYGCPHCGGAYADAFVCDSCDEWILGDYIKTTDGNRYCESCWQHMELGEEG
jgi:hypothetical protein